MTFADMRRGLAVACAFLLAAAPHHRLLAQDAAASSTDPQPFKLVVIRGENAQNNIKKGRATRPVVEVRDRNNKPVAGALVVFTLPSSGPSGTFVGGGQVASVTTNSSGQASASFTANSVPGKVNVNISSTVQGKTITAQIATYNVAGAVIAGSTLAILLGVVAAAGVGTAVALTRDGGSAATTPSGIKIGPGTGTVQPPR